MIAGAVSRLMLGACMFALPWVTAAQTPAPFPRPGQTQTPSRPPTQPQPSTPTPVTPPPPSAADKDGPGDLGVPIYPGAQFIASYDAGRGQRYYLYGTESDFTQIVGWYRTTLKQKGELVFEEPPVHMFEIGRYKEETMAFTPSVTVKDYTWAGVGRLHQSQTRRDARPVQDHHPGRSQPSGGVQVARTPSTRVAQLQIRVSHTCVVTSSQRTCTEFPAIPSPVARLRPCRIGAPFSWNSVPLRQKKRPRC